MNSVNRILVQKKQATQAIIVLGVFLFSAAITATTSASADSDHYIPAASEACAPAFESINPEKYSDIGEIESLSFVLRNNANPKSVSVQINSEKTPFTLQENKKGEFSGSIDVRNAKDGRQIVRLYADSNTPLKCSFREFIYVLYKNQKNNPHSFLLKNTDTTPPNAKENNTAITNKNPKISDTKYGNIYITFPTREAQIFPVQKEIQRISGTAPQGAQKIWVDFSDENGSTEHYSLQKFSQGDKTWNYFASAPYTNLSKGLNTYRVYAEFENGKFSEAKTVLLFVPTPDSTQPFPDTIGHWAEQSITFLRSKGIVHGRNIDVFAPDEAITKAESLKISTLSFAKEQKKYINGTFEDVKKEDWFAGYAQTAKEANIAETSEKNLMPNTPITPQKAEKIIQTASLKDLQKKISEQRKVSRAEFSDAVVKLMK